MRVSTANTYDIGINAAAASPERTQRGPGPADQRQTRPARQRRPGGRGARRAGAGGRLAGGGRPAHGAGQRDHHDPDRGRAGRRGRADAAGARGRHRRRQRHLWRGRARGPGREAQADPRPVVQGGQPLRRRRHLPVRWPGLDPAAAGRLAARRQRAHRADRRALCRQPRQLADRSRAPTCRWRWTVPRSGPRRAPATACSRPVRSSTNGGRLDRRRAW